LGKDVSNSLDYESDDYGEYAGLISDNDYDDDFSRGLHSASSSSFTVPRHFRSVDPASSTGSILPSEIAGALRHSASTADDRDIVETLPRRRQLPPKKVAPVDRSNSRREPTRDEVVVSPSLLEVIVVSSDSEP
jgi:hypothetical protein